MLEVILVQILCAAVITVMTAIGVWAPVAFITRKTGRLKHGKRACGESGNTTNERSSSDNVSVDNSSHAHHGFDSSAFAANSSSMPNSCLKARQTHASSGYHLVSPYTSAIMNSVSSNTSISDYNVSLHHQSLLSLVNNFSAAMLVTISTTRFMPDALNHTSASQVDRVATYLLIGIVVPAVIECAVSDAHGHSHGLSNHHHDHFDPSNTSNTHAALTPSFTTATLLVLLMCFHSMMEGLLLGLESSTSALLAIMIPLSLHKLLDGIVVGVSIAKQYQRNVKRWMDECRPLQSSHESRHQHRHSHALCNSTTEQTETQQHHTYASTDTHRRATGHAATSSSPPFHLTDTNTTQDGSELRDDCCQVNSYNNVDTNALKGNAHDANQQAMVYMLPLSQQQYKQQQRQLHEMDKGMRSSLPPPPPSPHDEVWCLSVILWLLLTPTVMILAMVYYRYNAEDLSGNGSATTDHKNESDGSHAAHGALNSLVVLVHAVGAGSFLYIGLSLILHEEHKGLNNGLAFLLGVGFTLAITYTNIIVT